MADRIKELASLVIDDSIIADIGTDHAYLVIELLKQNKIKYAFAIDNKSGPIENAKRNIKKYAFIDKVKIIQADGLSFDVDKSIDALIFAGMGGMNIIEIISKDITKLKNIKYIITDIHRNEDKAIKYLNNLDYSIDKEINVVDKGKKYHLIRFIKS